MRGQGEVGVAAAEVDHAQRPVRGLGGDDVVEAAEEGVDLAALGRTGPDRVEQGVVGGEPVLLGPVVRPGRRRAVVRGRPARCTCASPLLVTRSWTVPPACSTCQLP